MRARTRNSQAAPRGRLSVGRKVGFIAGTLAAAGIAAGIFSEAVFRVVEARAGKVVFEGSADWYAPNARWGWHAKPGWFRNSTPEFEVSGVVNADYMHDAPIDRTADAKSTRILALGDSLTFAIGAKAEETWAKVLERKLNSRKNGTFRTYNAAGVGYNLHQYLLRLIDQGPALRPHYVVVGLSYATDLYDLLPPDRGGWIYGNELERDYFDFDHNGRLTLRHWTPGQNDGAKVDSLRQVLGNSATFRVLRRSPLALYIGGRVRIGGKSLWPNMEVIVEREVSAAHEYQWRLAEALIEQMSAESRRLGAELIVVGVPYLPQIYDEVWNITFGGNERFNRAAAGERVAKFCAKRGIVYVETLDEFRRRATASGRWLHYRKDGHPTPEGHELIADVVAPVVSRR